MGRVVLVLLLTAFGRALAQEMPARMSVEVGGGVKMDFVLIRPGSFMMGSENGDTDEKPVHQVTITRPFYMGIYEVRQAQWRAVMGDNPSNFVGDDLPVECVS
jgi:formylglycine-generating enzyme required for sulfatase activity